MEEEKKITVIGVDEASKRMPLIETTPEQKFINSMQQGDIPEEHKGKNQYVFHRQTGALLVTFKDIYQNKKHVFEVWAKDVKTALDLFKKRIKWKKYKGDNLTQAEIDWPERFK